MDATVNHGSGIPASPEDFTPSWLAEVLSAGGADAPLEISKVDVEPVGVGIRHHEPAVPAEADVRRG